VSSVVIVDYNIGNVFSVCHALRQTGVEPNLTGDRRQIENADRVILPGVGAFASARDELENRGLIEPILKFVDSGRPFLGICVGMQLLMDSSTEFGMTRGLGLIPGKVDRIPETDAAGQPHVVPHISWAALAPAQHGSWSGTLLEPVRPGASSFYFVHSFMAYPESKEHVLAVADYNGRAITAAVRKDNITGVQFHPERSGPAGQKVLRHFLAV
jgi:glutamine amidotransferase